MNTTHNQVFGEFLEKINQINEVAKQEKLTYLKEVVIPYMDKNADSIYDEGVENSMSYRYNNLCELSEQVFGNDWYLRKEAPDFWVPSSWDHC